MMVRRLGTAEGYRKSSLILHYPHSATSTKLILNHPAKSKVTTVKTTTINENVYLIAHNHYGKKIEIKSKILTCHITVI
jgi:hypothetical protein